MTRAPRPPSRRPSQPAAAPRLKASLFFATRGVHAFDLSPDGEQVAFITTISGHPEVWVVPSSGGWPTQLTFDGRVSPLGDVAWSPDGRWIAYMADHHGDEAFEIQAVSASGGEPKVWVAHPGRRAYLGAWHDSGAILVTSNHANPQHMGVYSFDPEDLRLLPLHVPEEIVFYLDLSPDGRRLAFSRYRHNTWHELGVKDLQSGRVEMLSPTDGEGGSILEARFLPGENALLCVTDQQADRPGIARVDLGSGIWEWVEQSEHEIPSFTLSRDGRVLLWQENRDGNTVVFAGNRRSGRRARLPLPPGAVSRLRLGRDKRRLVVAFTGPRQPLDLHHFDPKTEALTPITHSFLGGLRPDQLSEPELLHFRAEDGLKLSGLYFPPTNGRLTSPHRALVWIHGGPESQDTLAYNPWIQFFANQGLGVLTVNFRGSTGFGRKFQRLIYRDWGGACYTDILAGVDQLIARGVIDPARLAVMGGSFGGYLTLWALTQSPERWRAGIDIFGPSNLETFARSVPEFWREALRDLVGDPERDRERLRQRSPIHFIDRIKAPLLVVQGAQDPRVTVAESRQVVAAIQARGGEVEYLELEREGHGFSHLESKILVMERSAAFLERMLDPQSRRPEGQLRTAESTPWATEPAIPGPGAI